jgi:biotin carboxylase
MKHLLFSEVNTRGIGALKAAKTLGHKVTYLHTPGLGDQLYKVSIERLKPYIDCLVAVEDSFSPQCLYKEMARIHKNTPFDGAIGLIDFNIFGIADACYRLGIPFTSIDAVATCRDKAAARSKLERSGLSSILWQRIQTPKDLDVAAKIVGFPAFLKPVSAAGSLACRKVENLEDLYDAYDEFSASSKIGPIDKDKLVSSEMLLEGYLEGEMFSVEVAAQGNQIVPLCTGQRLRFSEDPVVELGTTIPTLVGVQQEAEIENYGVAVVRALGLDRGIFHVEIMYTNRGPVLIEANPRLMGGNGPVTISHAIGQDVYELLISIHLGMPIPYFQRANTAITSRVLASTEQKVLDRTPSMSWLQRYQRDLVTFTLNAEMGQLVNRIGSNFGVLGSFEVRGATPQESLQRAREIQLNVEQELGLTLAY